MNDRLNDVWTTRDRPVLVEVVRRFEAEHQPVEFEEVAEALGISPDDVAKAARNLGRADLVEVSMSLGGTGDFLDVSTDALRIAGLWPDAGDAFDRLIWALEERISEAPPEEKGKLAKVRDAIVGVGRDVGVEVLGAALTGRLPM